jgi:hypothetical protein
MSSFAEILATLLATAELGPEPKAVELKSEAKAVKSETKAVELGPKPKVVELKPELQSVVPDLTYFCIASADLAPITPPHPLKTNNGFELKEITQFFLIQQTVGNS